MSEANRGASPTEALGQQVAALTPVVQQLQDGYLQLASQLQHLTRVTAGLNLATISTASPALAPGNITAPPLEPRVPLPERFSGDRRKFRAFKNASMLYMALQPQTFSMDSVKVGFIISLLTDEPQTWAHGLLEQKDPAISTVDLLFEAMAYLYDDPQRAATAENILHALQQGKRPVEDYTVDFRRLAADTQWNEAALRFQFRQGLSESLKDELARVTPPKTLEGLVQVVTQLDRRLKERRYEKLQTFRPTQRSSKASSPGRPTLAANLALKVGPSQNGVVRPALSPEEKLRRRQFKLCLYCGDPGHFLKNCPVRPSRPPPPASVPVAVLETSSAHFVLPIRLQITDEVVSVNAIIDSGACSCFLDLALAKRLHISLVPKTQPLMLRLADGSLPTSGPVQLETTPILTIAKENHQELIRFDVLDSPLFSIILGLPWLKAHDPRIQWSSGEIQFPSDYCQRHCLPTSSSTHVTCLSM